MAILKNTTPPSPPHSHTPTPITYTNFYMRAGTHVPMRKYISIEVSLNIWQVSISYFNVPKAHVVFYFKVSKV